MSNKSGDFMISSMSVLFIWGSTTPIYAIKALERFYR